jgi:hypothetical protein
MKIYKLKYPDKEAAIANFITKGVYLEKDSKLIYGEGIQAVVEIGLIVLTEGTYDKDRKEITAPILVDGYHYDVMSIQDIDFETNGIIVNNPKHNFWV